MTSAVYLDHAATAPLSDAARVALLSAWDVVGNASSLHGGGRSARRLVEESRESIAANLGVRPADVVITSGGTESDNLAIKGTYWARTEEDPSRRRILVTAIEHHAVLDPARWLARHDGAELVEIPVDADGVVDRDVLERELEHPERIAMASIGWANNEIGTIQEIAPIAAMFADHGVPLHSDAVQAAGVLDVDASMLTAMSVSGHKLGAPVGVGVLVVRREHTLTALAHGGGHERGLRSGTVNVAGVAALAAALDDANAAKADGRVAQMSRLRDRLIDGMISIPGVVLRGPTPGPSRLPGNAFFTVEGCLGDVLLFALDDEGIHCSTGSACRAGIPQPSHVLTAIGVAEDLARGAIRLTLSPSSTDADVDAALGSLPGAVAKARAAGTMWG